MLLQLRDLLAWWQRAVHPFSFIILLLDPQIRKGFGHDAARRAAWDHRILAEVCHIIVLPQEVFIEDAFTIDVFGWCIDDGENGV